MMREETKIDREKRGDSVIDMREETAVLERRIWNILNKGLQNC